jgi:hypothetical protein
MRLVPATPCAYSKFSVESGVKAGWTYVGAVALKSDAKRQILLQFSVGGGGVGGGAGGSEGLGGGPLGGEGGPLGGGGLGDHGGVIAEAGAGYARSKCHTARGGTQGCHPAPHKGIVPLLGYPRLEVIGSHDRLEAVLFRQNRIIEQFAGVELFEGGGVSDDSHSVPLLSKN